MVDDVAIWIRALSAAKAAVLYPSGLTGLSLGDLLRLEQDAWGAGVTPAPAFMGFGASSGPASRQRPDY
jgi:hypothetical protein